jgi:hypothetical protein
MLPEGRKVNRITMQVMVTTFNLTFPGLGDESTAYGIFPWNIWLIQPTLAFHMVCPILRCSGDFHHLLCLILLSLWPIALGRCE